MSESTHAELDCLRQIARPRPGQGPNCAEQVLRHLVSQGLVERVPGGWLPLETLRFGYRITAAGRELLQRHDTG